MESGAGNFCLETVKNFQVQGNSTEGQGNAVPKVQSSPSD